MERDLNMSSSDYSLVLSIFFVVSVLIAIRQCAYSELVELPTVRGPVKHDPRGKCFESHRGISKRQD